MNRILAILLITINGSLAMAAEIKGTVKDENGEPLPGVNVYIKDTYDGTTTDLDGRFSFTTFEEGTQVLLAQFVGYLTYQSEVDLSKNHSLTIQLSEEINRLSGVTITAGSFEASDEKKATVLKPLDIATTAGALADIPAALGTLPGTTTNGETGRLFVRGGTANETQAFIDGVKVHNFYIATPNNIPSRSRFSPFLFKGTFFSTGGYSAEYGQALSSVLSLNSNDIADQTQTNLSFMTVGLGTSHTHKYENGSVYGEFNYMDLDPYMSLVPQEVDWEDGYTAYDGTVMLRQKVNGDDMIKVYANANRSGFEGTMPSINAVNGNYIKLQNDNFYLNTTYKKAVGENSAAHFGVSVGETNEDIIYNDVLVDNHQRGYHAKAKLATDIGQVSLNTGLEVIHAQENEDVTSDDGSVFNSGYDNTLSAAFVEADYFITNNLTVRGGMRYAYYSMLEEHVVSPRLSMALKTGDNSQLSWAYGKFHQLPQNDLLLRSNQMSYEQADHYMLSYQSIQKGKTFRGEVYYKNYADLVKFDPADEFNPMVYNNQGAGYARGVDLFFRDRETFANMDYWISYSFIDTKRDHRAYPGLARPEFASMHNVSLVYKYFISSIRSQVGATYSFNSGRPYNNPNEEAFNNGRTQFYSDLSFNMAYLYRQNIILYCSASNLLGREQVFGYEFENDPGTDGIYDSRPIGQPAPRFFFVGLFITLTKDGKANNLDNL